MFENNIHSIKVQEQEQMQMIIYEDSNEEYDNSSIDLRINKKNNLGSTSELEIQHKNLSSREENEALTKEGKHGSYEDFEGKLTLSIGELEDSSTRLNTKRETEDTN